MEQITIQWQKCNDSPFLETWCRLDPDLLNDQRLVMRLGSDFYGRDVSIGITGVYIIWAGIGDNRTILKVGSGIIKHRLRAHLNDPKVQVYKHRGLYATWAYIGPSFKPDGQLNDRERGVERFLGLILNPELGERFPNNVDFILVNPPAWDEPENPFLRVRKQGRYLWPNR